VPLPRDELFVVSSTYPLQLNSSQRAIVLSALTDMSRQYFVFEGQEICPARPADFAKVTYKRGDLVQLRADRGASENTSERDSRCLGARADKRFGVVLHAGVERGGIVRNILVASEQTDDGDSEKEARTSAYSSTELMPFNRLSEFTARDKISLVQAIEALDEDCLLNASVLVGKFQSDVFSRLWAMLLDQDRKQDGAKRYEKAFVALQQWQRARMKEDMVSPALRTLLDTTDADFVGTFPHDETKPSRKPGATKSWQCSLCHAQCNDSERDSCLVCQTKVPTYACTVCLQDSKIFMRFCRHCHNPQSAMPRLRRKLSLDPSSVFARADIDSSGDLSLDEWQRAFRDEVIDGDVLKRLFDEFDLDKDGSVSLEEFKQGLERDHTAKSVKQDLFADHIEHCYNNPAKSPAKALHSDPEADKQGKPGYVKLYIADGEAARKAFQIKKSAKLSTLFAKYCAKRNLDVLDVEFTFKSQVLNGSQTPDDIGLQDLNTIFCIPDSGASQMNRPPPVNAPAGAQAQVSFTFTPLSTANVKPFASSSKGSAAAPFTFGEPPQQATASSSQQATAAVAPAVPVAFGSATGATGASGAAVFSFGVPAAGGGAAKVSGRKVVKARRVKGADRSEPATDAATSISTALSTAAASSAAQIPPGCRVQICRLPPQMKLFEGKSARVLSRHSDSSGICHYMCEFGNHGVIERNPFLPENLERLPGLPSNWHIQQDPVVSNSVEGAESTCWRVGALVALMEEAREPLPLCPLRVGCGVQTVGCIKSVDLQAKTVELAVVVDGPEVLLSQKRPAIGQLVRLSISYATLGDSRMGVLRPGENGVVLHVEELNDETLVLVKKSSGGFGFSKDLVQEEASWWYPCDALAFSKPWAMAGQEQKPGESVPAQPKPAPKPSDKKTSRPSVGSKVRLTADYKKVEDAELGPLKPGDIGILKGDDKSDVPFQVQAPDGTLWHYKEGAIEEIPAEPLAAAPLLPSGVTSASESTAFQCCQVKMEALRIIHSDDPADSRIQVPTAWSMLSELQESSGSATPNSVFSFPNKQAAGAAAGDVFSSKSLARQKQAMAEEDLDDETIAPIFRLEDSVSKDVLVDAAMAPAPKLEVDDTTICRLNYYDVVTKFDQFAAWGDRDGNLAAHHLAYAGLNRSLQALCSVKKSLRMAENRVHATPMMIADGVVALGCELPVAKRTLYRAIVKGDLLRMGGLGSSARHSSKLMSKCMSSPDDYDTPDGVLREIAQCLLTPGTAGKTKAMDLAAKCADARAIIYSAVAMLDLNMGSKQVGKQFEKYLQQTQDGELNLVDPMLYYARYLVWSKTGSNKKSERISAACALTALRCFPKFAAQWVDEDDDVDAKVKAEGLMDEDEDSSADEDEELDESADSPDSPEAEWKLAKSDHDLTAEAMDSLMALTGLREIKKKAMGVVKEVLLQRDRPASVKAETSMNFLFTGNPGCGKTTVAQLLAKAMTQLGFRKNDTMIETSAQEILKSKDPGSDFADMMEEAKGGCLFIDEAYRFTPSPPGQQPNASNQVLDYMLEAVEKPEIRSTTTVILAGYRDEIETLLSYNVGFASRFNITFSFPDYNEAQLRKIFVGMVKDKGFQLERKKDCGVSISAVMANRIHRGAGKKGFGNAREVRNKLEDVISQQSDRLGALKLRKKPVSEKDYQMLLAVDSVGLRPDFSFSPTMKELDSMVGLEKVKSAFRNLMSLQQQNFDREMRGDKPELISLHRVFYGNPGTGKTTVAKLYGSLLKELGLLSNGDFISVSPADLTGDHEGGAATQTKAVLDKAKGKVLLIDEAYVLDPKRGHNIYGGNVLDTMVEKLDGEAGSDCAVILAGYRQDMFDMLENNPGLRRRFNIDQFGIEFEDMADEELRQVLVTGVGKAGLYFEDLADLDAVVAHIGQQRRMPGFGNAGTVNSLLHAAKVAKSRRLDEAKVAYDKAVKTGAVAAPLPNPDALLRTDFLQAQS